MIQSARAALDVLNAKRFDVILCDLMMPDMTGMAFYDALHRVQPDVATNIVFVTGGAFTPAAQAFLDGAANERMDKPIEGGALRSLIRKRIDATSATQRAHAS